jgi:hypothetical protein
VAERSDPESHSALALENPPAATQPRWLTYADLRCLLCARAVGSIQSPGRGLTGPFLFKRDSADCGVRLAHWSRLRCIACGGNVYPDDARTVRIYPSVAWDDELPRRGRPPKWVVAARKAQASFDA